MQAAEADPSILVCYSSESDVRAAKLGLGVVSLGILRLAGPSFPAKMKNL